MAQKGLFLLLLLGISSIGITESTNISAAGNNFDFIMVGKKNYHGSHIQNEHILLTVRFGGLSFIIIF